MFDEPTIGLGAAPAVPQAPSMAGTASDTGEPPASVDGSSVEDAERAEDYALDSLYEHDMLEWVPVAPGELSHKRKQRGSAPPAAIAVASWRRYR